MNGVPFMWASTKALVHLNWKAAIQITIKHEKALFS